MRNMKPAVCFCIFASFATVSRADLDEDVRSRISNLENLVLDLTTSKVQMQEDMFKMKQEMQSKVTAQEVEIGVLRKKTKDLEEGFNSYSQDVSSPEKRLVLFDNALHAAFTVYLDHPIHNMTGNQAIVYNKILLNQGNFYNNGTGVFTAPTSGIYLFSYSVGSKALPDVPRSQYDIFTKLVINGDHQLSAVAESTGTYDDEQSSSTAVLYVPEGSQVWTAHQVRGGNSLFSTEEERMSSFTGVLLYQTSSWQ